MSRITRKLGRIKGEIVALDPDLLSIRLLSGQYLGGRIVECSDSKYHLAPGESPIVYDDATLKQIETEGWNVRHDYGDIEHLAQKIHAVGKILKPLSVVFDGDRLFLYDGHRRHFAIWLLKQRNCTIAEVPCIIKTLRNGESIRSLEYEMLSSGSDAKALTIVEKAGLIDRHLKEDLRSGLTEDQAKEKFLEETGWSAPEYENTLAVMSFPRSTQQQIDNGKVATTTVLELIRDSSLNTDEKINIIDAAIVGAEEAGKKKATGTQVKEIAQEFKEAKENGVINNSIDNSLESSDIPAPKPKRPRATAKEKAELLGKLVASASVKATEESIILTIEPDLWSAVLAKCTK